MNEPNRNDEPWCLGCLTKESCLSEGACGARDQIQALDFLKTVISKSTSPRKH